MVARYFEFKDEHSNKFWEAELSGKTCQIRFGKIGTDGQKQSNKFSSTEEARKFFDKKIREKLNEGYSEIKSNKSPASLEPRKATAEGCELTFGCCDIPMKSIRTAQDLFEAVKKAIAEMYCNFDSGIQMDLTPVFDDDDKVPIELSLTDGGEFVQTPKKGVIRIVQSSVMKHEWWDFECLDNEPITGVKKNFEGYVVMTDLKQGDRGIDFSQVGSGRPSEEPFGYVILDKDGERRESYANAFFNLDSDDWDKNSEKSLRRITDEWYKEIFE